MRRRSTLALALCAALAVTPSLAPAATTPPAKPVSAAYAVKGFRSALFGMDEAQVLAAAAKDLKVDPATAQRQTNPAEGTTVISFASVHVDPAPMPAQVVYIFGAASHRLVHVNIVWATPAGQEEIQRPVLIGLALKLRGYFLGYAWPDKNVLLDVPAGPNGVITFIGQDASGGAVEVMLQGVAYSHSINGQPVQSPTPSGPAILRLSYSQNITKPDKAVVAPGSF